jgi:O-methyltransferase involved in polyketide biosynthesis
MYLSEKGIEDTFEFIKNNSGSGSIIVLDYFYKSFILGNCLYYGANELLNSVNQTGEQYTFGIEEGQINNFLNIKGFNILQHYTPKEFEEKYLYDKNGKFLGNMYGFAGHVLAKTAL